MPPAQFKNRSSFLIMTPVAMDLTQENIREYQVCHTFDRDFINCLNRLHRQYGDDVFEVLGIANRNLDIARFSEEFFSKASANVADVSVDDNANVSEKNISHYESESTKALQKLNSLATMYLWVKKCFSKKDADTALERFLSGDIFINDMTKFNFPYSYYQETPILIRVNKGLPKFLSMRKLFEAYKHKVIILPDREVIEFKDLWKDVDDFQFYTYTPKKSGVGFRYLTRNGDISNNPLKENVKKKMFFEIWDGDRGWVELYRILRHKRHNRMVAYQTSKGDFSIVTEDHPVVLEDNVTTKLARDLQIGDVIKEQSQYSPDSFEKESVHVPTDLAYLVGFLLGDGNISRSQFYYAGSELDEDSLIIKMDKLRNIFYIYQKDIKEHKIYRVIKNTFSDIDITLVKPSAKRYNSLSKKPLSKKPSRLAFNSRALMSLYLKYFDLDQDVNSWLKSIPSNIMSWTKCAQQSFVAGLIDSEGTIAKTNSCNLRCASYNIISILSEVLTNLGIKHNKRLAAASGDKKLKEIGFDFLFGIQFMPDSEIFQFSEKYTKKFESYSNLIENYHPQMGNKKGISNSVVKKYVSVENPKIITYHKEDLLEWVYDVTTSSSTFYSNGMRQHNCFSFDLRNLIYEGMSFFSGGFKILPPKRSESYIALMIQSIAFISNQIAGACSFPDFFLIYDHFLRKEYGNKYYENPEHRVKIKNQFQNFIYSVNFPFRGQGQSPFVNLSVMDKGFMGALFSKEGINGQDYVFPDNTKADIESTIELSKFFFEYYTEINSKEGIFTFPVMTLAISKDDKGDFVDPEFVEWVSKENSEKCLGNMYTGVATSYSSCCRLKLDLAKSASLGYTNSFGVGGLSIGSHRCAGINLPRLALLEEKNPGAFEEIMDSLYKILYSHRQLLKHNIQTGTLPLYTTGWINLKRQYSTIGFLGLHEYFLNKGLNIAEESTMLAGVNLLKKIEDKLILWQEKDGDIWNCEQIPGESQCVKLCQLDTLLGYNPNEFLLYSNQYLPLWEESSIYDRFKLQGKFDSHTTGGAILHINVQDNKPLSPVQFKALLEQARTSGTVYFAINLAFSECEEQHYSIGQQETCPVCKKKIVNQYTRVVGYLSKVSAWNKTRRTHDYPKRHFYTNGKLAALKGNPEEKVTEA